MRYAGTPVETVAPADAERLAARARGMDRGIAMRGVAGAARRCCPLHVAAAQDPERLRETEAVLKTLVESYGVSGMEAPVREAVRRLLPAWAKPQVDSRREPLGHGRAGASRPSSWSPTSTRWGSR